jgi:hypothetical protein
LFLDVLGVQLQSPQRVLLSGVSPFERPAIVRWRGVEVRRDPAETKVTFPSGAATHVAGPEAVVVEET